MKLRPVQPLILLALALQLGGPARPFLGPPPAYAYEPVGECRVPLEEDDGVPEFLKDRATLREKFKALESLTTYPAELHGQFDANIKILSNPEDALAAKVLLIRNAQDTVDIAHFILKDDRAGKIVLAEVKAALLRGVTVRILVDSIGSRSAVSGIVSDLKAVLAANRTTPGKKGTVEAVVFNPQLHLNGVVKKWLTKLTNLFRPRGEKLPVPNLTMNNHLHDKIVAADLHVPERAVAIMGGRGIEEVYYPEFGYNPNSFRDMEVVLRNVRVPSGPFHLGDVLGTYYNSLYYHLGNQTLSLGLRNFLGRLARKRLAAMEAAAAAQVAPGTLLSTRIERLADEGYLENGFEPASLNFVHEAENAFRKGIWRDDLEHDRYSSRNPGSLTLSFREHMKQADEEITIVTPYVWFPPEEAQALRDWVDAKPSRRVRIITASIATDDSLVAQALIDADVGPAFMTNPAWSNARKQISVLTYGRLDDVRYGGPTWYGRLHAKYYLFDRKTALITSFNADPRSRYWSTESGFYIENSEAAVRQLLEDAGQLASLSTEWGSPEWKAIQDHPYNRAKTTLKNIVGRIMRALHLSPLV